MTSHDIPKIVSIHEEQLPSGLLALFGKQFLNYFYRFLLISDTEEVFVCELSSKDDILGFCSVSVSPNNILARSLKFSVMPAIVAVLINILKLNFRFFYYCVRTAFSIFSSHSYGGSYTPQIVFIAVSNKANGLGIGRALVNSSLKFLSMNNYSCLYTKTEDSEKNRAIGFYKKIGFTEKERINFSSKDYLILELRF